MFCRRIHVIETTILVIIFNKKVKRIGSHNRQQCIPQHLFAIRPPFLVGANWVAPRPRSKKRRAAFGSAKIKLMDEYKRNGRNGREGHP